MEHFETEALKKAQKKPKVWLRYVDDVFAIWPHGKEELNNFLKFLNTQNKQINFTIELEEKGKLPLLDTTVIKKEDGTLGHTVYRKATHTHRYLHANSHHHPAQINSVKSSLLHRARALADKDHLKEELQIVRNALKLNGFSKRDMQLNKEKKRTSNKKEYKGCAILPYIQGVSEIIGRTLAKHDIRPVFQSKNKIGPMLPSGKDKIENESQGVYHISCADCEKVYIGQTNRRIAHRGTEHKNAVKKFDEKSALAVHSFTEDHKIDFSSIRTLANIRNPFVRTKREALEIEIHKQMALNKRDDSKILSKSWLPILEKLQPKKPQQRKEINKNTDAKDGNGASVNEVISESIATQHVHRYPTRSRTSVRH